MAVAALAATAPAVGLLEGAAVPRRRRIALAPGDTLVVVSDGVSEALDAAGTEFDLAGVATLVAARPPATPPALPAAVVDAVRGIAAPTRRRTTSRCSCLRRTA